MTITMHLDITLKEFERLSLKLYYNRLGVRLLVAAGVGSLSLLLLHWFGVIKIFSSDFPDLPVMLVFLNTSYPFILLTRALEYYKTGAFQGSCTYTIDEEKISWSREGGAGYVTWNYVFKYEVINSFILLYLGPSAVIYLRMSKLSTEEITFIKSKVKTKE